MTTPCEKYIKEVIAEKGPIPLHEYMDIALFHETYGYYKQDREIIGKEGDFTTSPEITQMFGELIGLWAYDIWTQMGSPQHFQLIELGPGRGTLMADLLRATKNFPFFHQALSVHMVETNPAFTRQQQNILSSYPFCYWHERVSHIPSLDAPTLVIANEFFDAFPIDQFVFSNGKWHQRFVEVRDETLQFLDIETTIPLPMGKQDRVIEISTMAEDCVREVVTHIDRGAFLIIDYGYGHGLGDSLQALYNKKPCHVLEHAGEADITAHVNFQDMTNLLEKSGLRTHGPITQGQFLTCLGIRERAYALKQNATPTQAANLEAAIQRLTHPQQMGTLFKVIAATSDTIEPKAFPREASFRSL